MRYRVLTLVALVALAGCGSLAGGLAGGPTVSDAQVEIQDGSPVLAFNYTVSDYSDALLQGPSGQVINRGTIEPNSTEAGFYLAEPRGGNYTIIIQQGGSTEATLTKEFEGPNVVAEGASARWTGWSVANATLSVSNTGDLPSEIQSVGLEAVGSTNSDYVNRWLAPGESTDITVSSGFSSMTVTEPGETRGTVAVNTSSGVASSTFSRTFEGASLNITDVSPTWDNAALADVTGTVENTGDLPTEAAVEVRYNGDRLEWTGNATLDPGESGEFTVDPWSDVIYSATSGGETTLTVAARSQSETVTREISNDVSAAAVGVETSAIWESGQLQAITADIANTGDVSSSFSIEYIVNGEVVYTESVSELAGNSEVAYQYGDTGFGADPIYVSDGGQEEVTVRLTGSGVSASDSVTESFSGPDIEVTGTEATFFENYDEPTYELSNIDTTAQNTGDVVVSYDTVEYTIEGYERQYDAFRAELAPGETDRLYISAGDVTVSSGTHTVTFRFLDDSGNVIATDTATVTAE